MIICKRHVDHDDHLQKASWSGWSYARGRSIGMIICMRPVYQEDHLQEAGPSGWPFARGRSIRMIICKRPVDQDDHFQEASPSGWSFARGQSIRMIICKRPVHQDDHLHWSLVVVCRWSLFVSGRELGDFCLSVHLSFILLLFHSFSSGIDLNAEQNLWHDFTFYIDDMICFQHLIHWLIVGDCNLVLATEKSSRYKFYSGYIVQF